MSWFFEKFTSGQVSKEENNVKLVLQRIQTSTLYEEKLESIEKLLDLSTERKQDFGEEGINLCIQLLWEEKENIDIARPLLEALYNVLQKQDLIMTSQNAINTGSSDTMAISSNVQNEEQNKASKKYLNAIISSMDQSNSGKNSEKSSSQTDPKDSSEIFLTLILSLLSIYNNDYYIKYYCIQLIIILLRHDYNKMQSFILLEGTAISKFVMLLQDSQEAIRNEGLLLLNTLSLSKDQEITKIIAFEGTFEKLFEIVREEGGLMGGIIVHDCLQLVYNLIRENPSNQKYFREIGCIPNLVPLLRIDFLEKQQQLIQETGELNNGNNQNSGASSIISSILGAGSKLTQGMKAIIKQVLNIVNELVRPKSDNPSKSKDIICKSKLIDSIIAIALCDDHNGLLPDSMRLNALLILGWICYQHRNSQVSLESYSFILNGDDVECALVRLCKFILYEQSEMKRQVAFDTLKKFLDQNQEGQLIIASTVKPPTSITSTAEEGMLCGISLANAIFQKQARFHNLESFHATIIFTTIIRESKRCKEILQEMPYEISSNKKASISFFGCIVRNIIQSIRMRYQFNPQQYYQHRQQQQHLYHQTSSVSISVMPPDDRITLSLLRLLCEWIHDSPSSAFAFMQQHHSNFLFFVDLINLHFLPHDTKKTIDSNYNLKNNTTSQYELQFMEQFSTHVEGLCSLLLGMLFTGYVQRDMEYHEEKDMKKKDADNYVSAGGYTKETLHEVITKRIGLSKLKEKWTAWQSSYEFQHAQQHDTSSSASYFTQIPENVSPFLIYDHKFVQTAQQSIQRILQYSDQFKQICEKYPTPASVEIQNQMTSTSETRNFSGLSNQISNSPNASLHPTSPQSRRNEEKLIELTLEKEKITREKDQEIAELRAEIEKLKHFSQENAMEKEKEWISKCEDQCNEVRRSLNQEIQQHKEKYQQKEQELKMKQKEFISKQTHFEENIKNLNYQLDQKEKELDNLAKAYEQIESYLNEREQELNQTKNSLKQAESKLNQLERENERLKNTIQETQSKETLKNQSNEISDSQREHYEQIVNDLKKQLEDKKLEMNLERQNIAKERDTWVQKQEKQNSDARVLTETISSQQQNILEQKQKLDELFNKFTTQQSIIHQQEQQLQQFQQSTQEVTFMKDSLSKMHNELEEKGKQIDELNQHLKQRDERIDELEQDNLDMIDIIEKLEEKVKKIQAENPQ